MLRDTPVGVVARGRRGDVDRRSPVLEALPFVVVLRGDDGAEPLMGRTGDLERSRSGLGLLALSVRPGRSGDLARSRLRGFRTDAFL